MADNKKFKQGGMETVYSDINAEDTRNQQAEELLFQAWDVAGYHGQEGADYYPRTLRETEEMERLVKEAEAAVEDSSDKDLMDALYETRSVVEWSKQRHWTFSWWVVICVAIMGLYYFFTVDTDNVKSTADMPDEQPETWKKKKPSESGRLSAGQPSNGTSTEKQSEEDISEGEEIRFDGTEEDWYSDDEENWIRTKDDIAKNDWLDDEEADRLLSLYAKKDIKEIGS